MKLTTLEIAKIVCAYNSQVMQKLDSVSGNLFKNNKKYHSKYTAQNKQVFTQYVIPFDKFDLILEAFKHWENHYQNLKDHINKICETKITHKMDESKLASKIKISSLKKIQNPQLMSIGDLTGSLNSGELVFKSFDDYVKVETTIQLMAAINNDSLFKLSETTPKFIEYAMGLSCVSDLELEDFFYQNDFDMQSTSRFIHVNKTKLSFKDITDLFNAMMSLAP